MFIFFFVFLFSHNGYINMFTPLDKTIPTHKNLHMKKVSLWLFLSLEEGWGWGGTLCCPASYLLGPPVLILIEGCRTGTLLRATSGQEKGVRFGILMFPSNCPGA